MELPFTGSRRYRRRSGRRSGLGRKHLLESLKHFLGRRRGQPTKARHQTVNIDGTDLVECHESVLTPKPARTAPWVDVPASCYGRHDHGAKMLVELVGRHHKT